MKINFFGKKHELSDKHSEVLKVAILDSIRYAESEKAQFEPSDKEYLPLENKLIALNDLADELGLIHD